MNPKKLLTCLVVLTLLIMLGACSREEDESIKKSPAVAESVAPVPATRDAADAPPTSTPLQGQEENIAAKPAKAAPPEILSLKLEPALIFPGTLVKALVETSDSTDQFSLAYSWERNGEPLPGEIRDELDTTGLNKGDVITVLVTPFLGEVKWESTRSHPVVVLNRPPEITSLPTPTVKEGIFTYAVTASDPDGDTLNFSLETPPEGMKIDAETGLINWPVPAGFSDKVQVQIVVSDGDARSFQSFDMTVSNK